MSASIVVGLSFGAYILGYVVDARFLSQRVFELDGERETPAQRLRDDVDYLPTAPSVLFGHHYASITGLAPMLGPAVAVIWGWLPAVLWIVFGAIFVGCVHDFSALVLSVRHEGMSIGSIAESLVGPRAKPLFHLIIFFGISLAMGVFVIAIASLFQYEAYPQAILPAGGLMGIAVVVGLLMHRKLLSLGRGASIGFLLLLLLIGVAVECDRYGVSAESWPSPGTMKLGLLGYAFLASVLPVWSLLQPRDFINALLLYLGLGGLYIGFFLSSRDFVAPAVVAIPDGAPPLMPFVFITIACGAASGFHALVASGTTAKQLANERHARPIGYGGMIGESLLGLMAVLACTTGVLGAEGWQSGLYSSWSAIKSPGEALSTFIDGASSFLFVFGVGAEVARVFIAVVVVSVALTTLDSATRLLRYNIEEMTGGVLGKGLAGRAVSSFLAVLSITFFCFYAVDMGDGESREAGMVLWGLFGTTNQLLAGLTMLLATRYLSRRGRYALLTGIPMTFMLLSTMTAMWLNLSGFAAKGDFPLLVVGSILLFLAAWLVFEGVAATRRDRTLSN